VALEPFRETSYQLLMRAHAAVGNRAEALRVYEHCRRLLSEELGVPPSPQTEAVYLEILRS
jgi:SARP family transcriptional regulator, regulator of embCAB operon